MSRSFDDMDTSELKRVIANLDKIVASCLEDLKKRHIADSTKVKLREKLQETRTALFWANEALRKRNQ